MNFYYGYTVNYFNEIEDKMVTATGFTYGSTYSDTIKKVTDYYGELSIDYITLKCLTDDIEVVECDTEVVNAIENSQK